MYVFFSITLVFFFPIAPKKFLESQSEQNKNLNI